MNRREFLLSLPVLAGLAAKPRAEDKPKTYPCRDGKVCRYLGDETKDGVLQEFCLKLHPEYRKIIDEEFAEWQAEQKRDLPYERLMPEGDNCAGVDPRMALREVKLPEMVIGKTTYVYCLEDNHAVQSDTGNS
jgi:hypothetical protein